MVIYYLFVISTLMEYICTVITILVKFFWKLKLFNLLSSLKAIVSSMLIFDGMQI